VFLPIHLPDLTQIEPLFTALAEALVAFQRRVATEVPLWAEEFRFPLEESLLAEDARLVAKLEEIRSKESTYSAFKSVLCRRDEPLVDSVTAVLREGFNFLVPDQEDENIEDRVIQDATGTTEVLVEIKGKSKNVTNETINQTDSHRERRGLPGTFPAVLVINSFAEATTLEGKDQPVALGQVQHAARNGILILRTLDLLRLLALKEKGVLDAAAVLQLLKTAKGWLRVEMDSYAIETGA